MFGCAGRIGCAIVLLIAGAVGWHYRAKWVPPLKHFISAKTGIDIGTRPAEITYTWGDA